MRPNEVRRRFRAGNSIINAWLSIPSAYAAEITGHAGFDAVTVDLQHGMCGFESAVAMLQALSSTPAVPLVRPTSADPVLIMRLLDAGAYGVIVPQVDTPAICRQVVAACRYPPQGTRSFGPSRGLLYGGADYVKGANDEILVLAMIESAQALASIDEILSVPSLDGLYVGPNDLAMSLGLAPGAIEAEVETAIAAILAAGLKHGLLCGIFCPDGATAAQRLAQGFHLVTPGNDAAALRGHYARALAAARGETSTGTR